MTEPSSSATQLMRAVRENPADPIAAILSAVLTIAGALELSDRLGITADQLALVLGALGTIAATVRAALIAGRK